MCDTQGASQPLAVGLFLILVSGNPVVPAQPAPPPATVASVLARATEHVTLLQQRIFNMVAEERYDQRYTLPTGGGFGGRRGDVYERRRLRSDYLLVKLEGEDRHYGFRDVFEVDGRAVRDREERLADLFLQSSLSSRRQIRGVLDESSRYNIGDVERNINTPTLALLFLEADYKPRFKFERTTDTSPSLGIDRPEPIDELWVLSYVESWPTTVIRGQDGGNRPAQGRYWIDPITGGGTGQRAGLRECRHEGHHLGELCPGRGHGPPRAARNAGTV